jgi:WD40 repeat protein
MNRPGHELTIAASWGRSNRPATGTCALLLFTAIALTPGRAVAQPPKSAAPVSFKSQVAPILVKHCLGCHSDLKASGGLSMTTFSALKRGGKNAGDTILEPGDPDSSYLIESIRPGASPRMPYKLPPLADGEIATLARWVKEGAKYDGPPASGTRLALLVDVMKDLPKVALKSASSEALSSLAYSPDGRRLAAALGRQVLIFESDVVQPVVTLEDQPGPVTAVRFTPDGRSLIAAGGRAGLFGSLTFWDLEKRSKRFEAKEHSDSILAAEIAPDGQAMATAGYDKQILIWDLKTGKVVRALKDHSDSVYSLAFARDGKMLASCAADRSVKLWDWKSGKRMATFSDSTAELYCVVFTPDGSRLVAAGVDRSIRMYRIGDGEPRFERSAFAHEAAIVRLAVSSDGRTLASSAEDRTIRLWKLPTLEPESSITPQADWTLALAFRPDGKRLALGGYDGSLVLWDLEKNTTASALRKPPEARSAASATLVREASLDPPSPRGGVRGSRVHVTFNGTGVGRATTILIPEPGLTASNLPATRSDERKLEIDLTIAPTARVGLHTLGVITPLGVPTFQTFAVAADPELAEHEPNDRREDLTAKPAAIPATLLGTIDRPGDVDHFTLEARAGQQLVFQVVARSLGSQLRPLLSLVDRDGNALAQKSSGGAPVDPIMTYTARSDGPLTLQIADTDHGGSGAHFYRIAVGAVPFVESVYPLGAELDHTTKLEISGSNLEGVKEVALPVGSAVRAGSLVGVPVVLKSGSQPLNAKTLVAVAGRQVLEQETNDTWSQAQPLVVPGGVSGHIGHDGDVDFYRFRARKGEHTIVEIFGRRLGTRLDSVIEVLDAKGSPIARAVLRPVDRTEVAFRDHGSNGPNIRLTRWEHLAVNDYILFGRELARIQALPRNPDDDAVFWNQQGLRLGLLETTPEHHPMSQPMYKVEIHPPGTVFPAGGIPASTLNYANDDGGPSFSKDSRVTFEAPADGEFLVRVEDVRGLGGGDFGYHLVLRRPRPEFRVDLGSENPNIPRGGTTLIPLSVNRFDGFDGPLEVKAENLPPGVTATTALIDGSEFSGMMALTADLGAPAFSPPTWRVIARAIADPGARYPTSALAQEIDPGGPNGGWITVTPEPNLKIVARPERVLIHPGERVSMTLAVERGPAFKGRVPIEVKNLPQGVRVLNIGLNGVLITEAQTERSVFILAEPWAKPVKRPFFAVGKAEAAGTDDSSLPIELVVLPDQAAPAASSRSSGK